MEVTMSLPCDKCIYLCDFISICTKETIKIDININKSPVTNCLTFKSAKEE